MNFLKDIQNHYKKATIVEQLIYINIAVFVLTLLFSTFSGLYKNENNFIIEWFSLSSETAEFINKPWSIISYGFLHADFFHILFNCLWLYLFGRLFLDYFTPKQLLNFYLLGTLCGGILFVLSINYFPVFKNQNTFLVGASAGISAIIMGTATYIPNYQLKFPLIGFVKVWHLAAVFILLDLFQLSGRNGGGHFAHLGGALFGFLYVTQTSNKTLDNFNWIINFFKTKEKPLKTVYKSGKKTAIKKATKTENQQKIDEILDKISKSGYDTLTKTEKDFLFKQGKN